MYVYMNRVASLPETQFSKWIIMYVNTYMRTTHSFLNSNLFIRRYLTTLRVEEFLNSDGKVVRILLVFQRKKNISYVCKQYVAYFRIYEIK